MFLKKFKNNFLKLETEFVFLNGMVWYGYLYSASSPCATNIAHALYCRAENEITKLNFCLGL